MVQLVRNVNRLLASCDTSTIWQSLIRVFDTGACGARRGNGDGGRRVRAGGAPERPGLRRRLARLPVAIASSKHAREAA